MKRPGQAGSFLRRAGAADVFLVDSDLFAFFGIYGEPKEATLSANPWIDLSVETPPPAEEKKQQ